MTIVRLQLYRFLLAVGSVLVLSDCLFAVAPPVSSNTPPGFRCVRVIQAHRQGMRDLAFSPDGTVLASTGDEKLVLWDVRSGTKLREVGWEEANAAYIAFVSGGKEIACTGEGANVWIRDFATLKVRRTYTPSFGGCFIYLSASQNGTLLASTESTQVFNVWDVHSGKRILTRNYIEIDRTVNGMAFSPDNKLFAIACDGYTGTEREKVVRLFDLASGKEISCLSEPYPVTAIKSIAFSGNGRFLAVGYYSYCTIHYWDTKTGNFLGELTWKAMPKMAKIGNDPPIPPFGNDPPRPPSRGCYSLAISKDSKTIAVGCYDGRVRLYELATNQLRHETVVEAMKVVFSPDGKLLAGLSPVTGNIYIWEWRYPALSLPDRSTASDLARSLRELDSEDAAVGYQAVASLLALPEEAVTLLARHMKPIEKVDPERLRRLVTDLDDDNFAVRETASWEIQRLGGAAESFLNETLQGDISAEVAMRAKLLLQRINRLRGLRLERIRAVEVLETIGSPAAQRLLENLARGLAARETTDAREALDRLHSRR